MEQSISLKQWALSFLNDSDYEKLIKPIIDRNQKPEKSGLLTLYSSLENVQQPPSDVLNLNNGTYNRSNFEIFIQNIYDESMPSKLLKKLLDFIPKDRISRFLTSFSNLLSFSDMTRAIASFPEDCEATQFQFSKLFFNGSTFLIAFSYFMQNYSKFSSEMKKYYNRCFRDSLSKGICKEIFIDIIHLAFELTPVSSPQANENNPLFIHSQYSEALDVFFSALTSDASILMNYCNLKDVDHLFDHCKIRNDLPPSFLRFLTYTSANYIFTAKQFWTFIDLAPSPVFAYINHLDDMTNESMWISILATAISVNISQNVECQAKIFLAFLYCILQRPEMMNIFISLNFHVQFTALLNSKIPKIVNDHSLTALLISYLTFTRINEETAKALSEVAIENEMKDDNPEKGDEISFCKSALNFHLVPFSDDFEVSIKSHKSSHFNYQIGLSTFFELLIEYGKEFIENALLWVIAPKRPFPIQDLIQFENDQIISWFPYPSYTFITVIAPKILRAVINRMNEPTIRKLLAIVKSRDDPILFREMVSPDLMKRFLEKANTNELYYEYVTIGLSISCTFSVFSPLFKSICTDIDKTIDFLTILSQRSPLVNDFLHINAQYSFTSPVMNGTIMMWIRVHTNSGTIFVVEATDTIIEVWHEFNDFYLSFSNGDKEKERPIVNKISSPQSIDNWYFVVLSLTPKQAVFSVNLDTINVNLNAGNRALLTIGAKNTIFDLQSLKVERPVLSQDQIIDTFSLGPNFKESIITDFFSFKDQQPLYVTPSLYSSDLYITWFNLYNSDKENSNEASATNVELSIRPPFTETSSSRKRASMNIEKDNTPLLLDKRITYTSFLNSFDASGGIPYLVHIWAEILLKKVSYNHSNDVLVQKMFNLISILLNKYPLFHHYFLRNSVYCLIGKLMKQTKFDALPLAVDQITRTIYNVNIIKYWVLGPSLENYEFPDSIKTLIDVLSDPLAQKIMHKAKCFVNIVHHISQGNKHTPHFLKLLCNLAMTMTNQETCLENATYLFNILMIQHLQFAKSKSKLNQADQNETSTSDQNNEQIIDNQTHQSVTLVQLMHTMIDTFPILKDKLQLELMIPAVMYSTNYQFELIDLLINYLNEDMRYIFSVVLMSINGTPELSLSIYITSMKLISENNHTFDHNIHLITFPMLYFASHLNEKDNDKHFNELVEILTPLIDSFTSCYPHFLYNQMLQILFSLEERFNNDHPNLVLPEDIKGNSSFSTLFNTFITRGILNQDTSNIENLFLIIVSIKTIAVYRKIVIALFYIAKSVETLKELKIQSSSTESFLKFCLSYGSFAFKQIQMIPGDKTEQISFVCCYFLKQLLEFGEILDSNDIFKNELDTLTDFTSLNSISSLIVNDIQSLPRLSKQKRFSKTLDMLQNPTGYPPVKIKHQKLEKDLEKLEKKLDNMDIANNSGLMTIFCNAVQYQKISEGEITMFDENEEKIIQTWHHIFDSLFYPSSRIFEHCPKKFKINEVTSRFERRRTLIPINPASDPIYASYYTEKYNSELPKIRLTLNEVLSMNSSTLSHSNDVAFSGDAVRLTGIFLRNGILVVLSDHLKFYQRVNQDFISFNFDTIRCIRLINYMHQPRGILLETKTDDVYLFAFEAQSIRDGFVEVCESIKKFPIIKEIDKNELEAITDQWREGIISNFEYLLKLNFISGRTWSDFTQFPVFPWILTDFTSQRIDLNDSKYYRNLEYPLFAQTKSQQSACESYYETVTEIGNSPHHFPKYISHVGSTLYFLVRLEPFTDAELDFQGGCLDAPDRTFQSFSITTELMLTPGSKSCLELVPEVYFIPEMLENINSIQFSKTTSIRDVERDISNVALPPWAKSPIDFVQTMRDALESRIVSQTLNEWIDLIWGFRRQGKASIERYNVLQKIVYDYNPEEYMHDYLLLKAMNLTIHNCGQAPKQLFDSPHPKKRFMMSREELTLKFIHEKQADNDANLALLRKTSSSISYGGVFIDVKRGLIGVSRNAISPLRFPFANEIKPICIAFDNNNYDQNYCSNLMITSNTNINSSSLKNKNATFVIGHNLPFISHWSRTNKGLRHNAILRGRLTKINCVLYDSGISVILAGHVDGYVSVFSTNPYTFIREICGNSDAPITLLRIMRTNSHIITFQKENSVLATRITLWTINGDMISVTKIHDTIIDCVVSSFAEGTARNVIILLNDDNTLILFKADTLEERGRWKLNSKGYSSLQMWRNTYDKYLVLVTNQDNRTLSLFSLEPITS